MASYAAQTVPCTFECLRFRMRAYDQTEARVVYWFSSLVDKNGNDYEGPGPLVNIVVSNVLD